MVARSAAAAVAEELNGDGANSDELSPAPVVPASVLRQAIAALPPRQVSPPEEIARRRDERRARIEREKAEGSRNAKGRPIKSAATRTILEMVRRQGADGKPLGATMDELRAALGWGASTVRGYIGGHLRPAGHDIRVSTVKGEPRRYVIGHDGPTFSLRQKGAAK